MRPCIPTGTPSGSMEHEAVCAGASTQTAILMVFIVLLTAAQFLFLGRRINYER